MKFSDMLKRSGRNLRQSKIRTILTASAIAVGGFTLTLTLAAATGARQYSDKLISANINPNSVSVAKDEALFNGTGSTAPKEYSKDLGNAFGMQVKQLNQQDISRIKAVPHVTEVLEGYEVSAQFITREGAKKYTGALTVYDSGQKPPVSAGTSPDVLPEGSIIMPDAYLKLLNFASAEDALGKTITVQMQQLTGFSQGYRFKVAAVSTKSAFAIDFVPVGLYLNQDDARKLHNFVNAGTVNEGKVPAVSVTTDGTDAEQVKEALKHVGYAAVTAKDAQKFLYQIIDVLQIIILVFGFITLVASFFGVVNTQYISVLERTREIGLMKALGMSKRAVSRLFIIEATWIGFLGAFVGSLLAIFVGTLLNPVISEKLNFGDQHLLVFMPSQIIMLVVFLMLVTTLAGLLPARKAAKLDPIEALRTE